MKNAITPIEVIAHFGINGKVTPYRFRYEVNSLEKVVIINSVITRNTNNFSGNLVHLFECATQKDEEEIRFEIRFEAKENKWYLTKF